MKTSIRCVLMAAAITTASCNSNPGNDKNQAPIETIEQNTVTVFTVDGASCKGKVSTQYFGSNKETDNFSVLCQQDEPLVLLQITFANEKDAAKSGLTAKGFDGYKVNEGQFDLVLTPAGSSENFVATDKSGGSVKLLQHTIVISNMKLFNREGKEKLVNGTIEY